MKEDYKPVDGASPLSLRAIPHCLYPRYLRGEHCELGGAAKGTRKAI